MKKFTYEFKRMLMVATLVTAMVASSVVSFAYWKTGITGDSTDRNINIVIGSGSAVSSSINLSEIQGYDGKSLIPHHRDPDTNEVNQIVFTTNVKWVIEPDQSLGTLVNTGHLMVTLDSITLESEPGVNLATLISSGTTPLFEVIIDVADSGQIVGSQDEGNAVPLVVTITVRLNEPADRYQYNLIAGKRIVMTLNFDIQSSYDLDIPESPSNP